MVDKLDGNTADFKERIRKVNECVTILSENSTTKLIEELDWDINDTEDKTIEQKEYEVLDPNSLLDI